MQRFNTHRIFALAFLLACSGAGEAQTPETDIARLDAWFCSRIDEWVKWVDAPAAAIEIAFPVDDWWRSLKPGFRGSPRFILERSGRRVYKLHVLEADGWISRILTYRADPNIAGQATRLFVALAFGERMYANIPTYMLDRTPEVVLNGLVEATGWGARFGDGPIPWTTENRRKLVTMIAECARTTPSLEDLSYRQRTETACFVRIDRQTRLDGAAGSDSRFDGAGVSKYGTLAVPVVEGASGHTLRVEVRFLAGPRDALLVIRGPASTVCSLGRSPVIGSNALASLTCRVEMPSGDPVEVLARIAARLRTGEPNKRITTLLRDGARFTKIWLEQAMPASVSPGDGPLVRVEPRSAFRTSGADGPDGDDLFCDLPERARIASSSPGPGGSR
jgi:hypothetical protein